MRWDDCLKEKISKKASSDEGLINSLIESSKSKLESAKRLKIDSVTANSVISLCYDSIREILEALASKRGFKIYNHECFTSFLKEIMRNPIIGEEFDRFRKIRNKINYYGGKLEPKEAESLFSQMAELRVKLMELLK